MKSREAANPNMRALAWTTRVFLRHRGVDLRHGEMTPIVDGALTPPAHRGHDPHSEKRAHVFRHLARLALAVTAARSYDTFAPLLRGGGAFLGSSSGRGFRPTCHRPSVPRQPCTRFSRASLEEGG